MSRAFLYDDAPHARAERVAARWARRAARRRCVACAAAAARPVPLRLCARTPRTCSATRARHAGAALDARAVRPRARRGRRAGLRRRRGHDDVRGAGRGDAAARRDAGRGAGAQDDHAGRRGRRRGHRGDVVPAGPRARDAARDRRAHRPRRRSSRAGATTTHADLFYGFPNSYGTLGYALRLRARTRAGAAVRARRATSGIATRDAFFAALATACASDADFVDGVAFAPDALYLNVGRFIDDAPSRQRLHVRVDLLPLDRASWREDHLTTHDYLWRWDTDWFWCSKNLGAQNPLVRRLLGRQRLSSRTYQKIMRWNAALERDRAPRPPAPRPRRVGDPGHRRAARGRSGVPARSSSSEVPIAPVWICPLRGGPDADRFALYPLRPGALVRQLRLLGRRAHGRRRSRRRTSIACVEDTVARLGGIKSLYSESFYDRAAFDAAYGGDGVPRAESPLRSRRGLPRALRQVRAEGVTRGSRVKGRRRIATGLPHRNRAAARPTPEHGAVLRAPVGSRRPLHRLFFDPRAAFGIDCRVAASCGALFFPTRGSPCA